MIGFIGFVVLFFMLRLAIRHRRRNNARRDLTEAYRADTAGLHARSPRSLWGPGGGL